jgi:NADH-quinone oxidoreductase subunit A
MVCAKTGIKGTVHKRDAEARSDMLTEYYPILYTVILAILFAGVTVFLSHILGPRRKFKVKNEPYECGLPSEGIQYADTPIKFYVIALLFLVFDLEAVFLYPWAVYYKKLGLFGFVEMLLFILILLFCYIYVWKKGALEWE